MLLVLTKCQNVNQADYTSHICSPGTDICLEITSTRSSFNNLPTMNWHIAANILQQRVQTQLDTLLDFNTYMFH